MKDKLVGEIMKELVGLKEKTYSYLKDNNDQNKKAKGWKSLSQKEKLNSKIKKAVQKQLNLRINETILKKIKLTQIVLKKE